VESFRFSKIRMARRVLGIKGRVAAGIMGMAHGELYKAERVDAIVPIRYVEPALTLVQLAERIQSSFESAGKAYTRQLMAILPFKRFRCLKCHNRVHVAGSKYSVRRGEYWYFKCPRCGSRFWSTNGTPNLVKPKGGNWRILNHRVRCPDCLVDCNIVAPPSKSNRSRLWECPKCRKRYRNVAGRAVLNQPVSRASIKLPFLKSRECPDCQRPRLALRARPNPSRGRYFYYFVCSACGSSYRFDKELGGLVRLGGRNSARSRK
jgi:hypothetical protein